MFATPSLLFMRRSKVVRHRQSKILSPHGRCQFYFVNNKLELGKGVYRLTIPLARKKGFKFYYNSSPCKECGDFWRYVTTWNCVHCHRAVARSKVPARLEKQRQQKALIKLKEKYEKEQSGDKQEALSPTQRKV